MKKFTLLIASLFITIGAMAQPQVGKYYKIKGNHSTNPWLTANMNANGNPIVSSDEADAAVFLKTENGLKAIATDKYLGYSGGKFTYNDSEVAVTIGNLTDGMYTIVSGGNYMYNNSDDGIVHESSALLEDIPRLWGFIEVTIPTFTQTYVRTDNGAFWGSAISSYPDGVNNAKPENAGNVYSPCFNIDVENANSITVSFEHKTGWHALNVIGVDIVEEDGTVVASHYEYKVAGGGTTTSGQKIYTLSNVPAGTYMLRYFVCNTIDTDDVTLAGGDIIVTGAELAVKEVEERTIKVSSSDESKGVAYIGTLGTTETTSTYAVEIKAAPVDGYSFKNWTVDGEVVSISATYIDETEGDKEYVANFYKKITTTAAEASITHYGTYPAANIIDGDYTTHYWAGGNQVEGTTATVTLEGTSKLEEIRLHFNGNDMPDAAKLQVSMDGENWTDVAGSDFTSADVTSNNNIYVCDATGTIAQYVRMYVVTPKPSSWFQLCEVEAFGVPVQAVEISAAKYATFFSDKEVAVPEGVTAYYITADNVKDGYVRLAEVGTTIPANTGVILNAEVTADTEYIFPVTNTGAAAIDGNLLTGTTVRTLIEEPGYVLGVVEENVGLYKATIDGSDASQFYNGANKAYLPASAVPNKSAAFYGFDWGGTTGIDEITENGVQNTVIYDLTGRRVETITEPGIYIVGGKKVLVK